jgi:putative ABC transport system permease protein
MSTILSDFSYAFRLLTKNAGFTVVAIITLALGIGANTAIFTLVNAALLRPLPFDHPDELMELGESTRQTPYNSVSYPEFLDWRQQNRAFERMAAICSVGATLNGEAAERITLNLVSGDFSDIFRVKPVIGRNLRMEDDTANGQRAAMVSYGFWQRHFRSDPAIAGQPIVVDKRAYVLIGVLPRSMQSYRKADVYVPFETAADRYGLRMRENHAGTYVVARRRPGVTVDQARTQMDTIARRLEQQYPATNTGSRAQVSPLQERISGHARPALLVLWGAVAIVLLIACLNVANLLLARLPERNREMAIRTALGARPSRVVRQLLIESALLSLGGGAFGLLLACWGLESFAGLVATGLPTESIHIDVSVLAFTVTASLLAGILFGLTPSLHAVRTEPNETLKESGRPSTSSAGSARIRDFLVVGEVALAMVLLVGAGLLIRSLYGLVNTKLGFETDHIVTMNVDLPGSSFTDLGKIQRFYRELADRVQATPGVVDAAVVTNLSLTGSSSEVEFYLEGRPVPPRGQLPRALYQVASPGYFRTMGIPLLKGRIFDSSDTPPVFLPQLDEQMILAVLRSRVFSVVINQTMARQYWQNEDVIGKRFRFGFPEMNGPWLQVVGMVGDTRQTALDAPIKPAYYFSSLQFPLMNGVVSVVARTQRQPGSVVADVRKVVAALDKEVPVTSVGTVEQIRNDSIASRRNNMLLLGVFSGLALILALIGIYGVTSYAVARRTHEIGIRVAVGAGPGAVLRLVIRQGMSRTLIGIISGLALAAALTRVLSNMLYGVGHHDPLTFASVALLIVAVALAANYIPAHRAARVDPVAALRFE